MTINDLFNVDVELIINNKEFYIYEDNDFFLPEYATEGSAAMDLRTPSPLIMLPGGQQLVDIGLSIWIKNPNVCGVIIPRSGLGHNDGLVLGNGTGLIDSDYQGPLKVSLWNRSEFVREYEKGARIAQLVFLPKMRARFTMVSDFSDETSRGVGGYGSTGVE